MNALHRPAQPVPDIPATGAWRPGDAVGNRRFTSSSSSSAQARRFALEGGGVLANVEVAYETWGELDPDGSNAVLVCHALTGDAHASGPSGPGQPTEGWWNDLIGPNKALDTNKYLVVCANVLGGCQGTTGPSSLDPDDGRPYGSRFPVVSVRDMVRTQVCVADELGISRWLSVVGGSMGGMQVLEWAIMYPDRVQSFASLASSASASAMQIGWSKVGRLAIALDSKWRGGDYYDAPVGDGPHEGLMLARRIAQIHYRSDQSMDQRFGRATLDRMDTFELWDRFQVESYLDHHGQKLARRFDANSYLVLNKAMDLHDVGRGRGGTVPALSRIAAEGLVVTVDSDQLYHPRQQLELCADLTDAGVSFDYEVVHSDHGHDGFLMEFDQLDPVLGEFLERQLKAAEDAGS